LVDIQYLDIENLLNSKQIKKKGRKFTTNKVEEENVLKIIQEKNKLSWRRIGFIVFEKLNLILSPHVLRRIAKKYGIKSYIMKLNYVNSERKMKERLSFAETHINKDDKFWDTTIFMDEKTLLLRAQFQAGNNYVKCRQSERFYYKNCVEKISYNFDGIKFWACVSSQGLGKLYEVKENLNKKSYAEIIKGPLSDSISKWWKNKKIKQLKVIQDNDSTHNTDLSRREFEVLDIEVLRFPATSPDLNIIENIWAFWQKLVHLDSPKTLDELRSKAFEKWSVLKKKKELIKALYQSMPRRLQSVIDRQGEMTKY